MAVLELPLTLAMKFCVAPARTLAELGVTVTVIEEFWEFELLLEEFCEFAGAADPQPASKIAAAGNISIIKNGGSRRMLFPSARSTTESSHFQPVGRTTHYGRKPVHATTGLRYIFRAAKSC
jgi:hypothetical protein